MITITLNQIKSSKPCIEGWKKVLKANGGTNADMDKPFPMVSILDSNDLDGTVWCMRCLPEYSELWREFACWCALQNIELIKPHCSDYNYELIVKYLTTRDEPLRATAAAYADVARSGAAAAYAAAVAADVARFADADAVYVSDAAWAADAESYAAYAAAWATAYASYFSARAAEAAAHASYFSARAAEAAARAADDSYAAALAAQTEKLREILTR